jgi:hypothetical protein
MEFRRALKTCCAHSAFSFEHGTRIFRILNPLKSAVEIYFVARFSCKVYCGPSAAGPLADPLLVIAGWFVAVSIRQHEEWVPQGIRQQLFHSDFSSSRWSNETSDYRIRDGFF